MGNTIKRRFYKNREPSIREYCEYYHKSLGKVSLGRLTHTKCVSDESIGLNSMFDSTDVLHIEASAIPEMIHQETEAQLNYLLTYQLIGGSSSERYR
jgi:hypothetical protein